jgi:crotonobetainyl-CoA:carnitine CoA-transferase CaiB-like acyl-CoA transferase
MAGPLHGLKVVEIGLAMAGPFAGMMLADYGAEVIKIERIGVGDDSRHWPPYFHDKLGYYFASANRNKASVAVDLKSPEGVEIASKLIDQADIVIDNFRPGVLQRLGLDYASLSESNPRLIYCGISGFGSTGPRRLDVANDLFMQAFSGGMSITGEPEGSPVKMAISIADIGGAMFALTGILMALEERHRTGKGQLVETSLLEGQLAMLSYHLTNYFATGEIPGPTGSGTGIGVPYQAFKAADDWVVIAVFNDRMWADFCRAVGRPEWERDPKFVSANVRLANRDELIGLISTMVQQHPVALWESVLGAAGVPCTRVNNIEQVVEHEQVKARDMVVTMTVPDVGEIKMAGLPIKFSRSQPEIGTPPPALGADTRAVLQSLAYSSEQIEALVARSVVSDREGTA